MSGQAWPCVIDGRVVADGVIELSATAEALTHGEGLFESLPVIDGRPWFLPAHLRRLDAGARSLFNEAGPAERGVRAQIAELCSACRTTSLSLRISLLREHGRSRILLVGSALPEDVGRPIDVCRAAPAFNGPRALGSFKTLNYLASRLAHADAARRGFDEAVFTSGEVILEGTRSSVFAVFDGTLATPPLDLPILPGVTRDVVIGAARASGIAVEERTIVAASLETADEVFVTASVRGVRGVRSFEGRPIRRCEGPVTQALAVRYRELAQSS